MQQPNQQINIIAQVSQDDPSKPAQYQANNNNNGIEEYNDEKKIQKKNPSLYELICKCLIFRGNNTEESDDETEYPPTETNKQCANSEQSQNISIIQDQTEDCLGKKTLVLDLDETLVHSSFTPMKDYDYKLDITVQGTHFTVYVKKRAGCEDFLIEMAKYYEIFIYTASLSEYADPVIDLIDPTKTVAVRLYRQHCTLYNNIFVKDMTKLNRNIKDIIIIDNSEASFLFQPENAIHIKAFFEDMTDLELYRMMPFLQFQSINYDVRYVMRWLEIFEQAEEEVIYLDEDKNQQTYPKQAELDEFEELFPYKYAEAMAQQQQVSYEEPLTNRRGSNEDQKNDEDDLELDDNLDSHKGMLKNKIQYEDYQNGNYERKKQELEKNEQYAEETDKDINLKQENEEDGEVDQELDENSDQEEEIKNYENYNQEDDSDFQESNEDKQNQQIIKQKSNSKNNKRDEKRKKQMQQKNLQHQSSDSGSKKPKQKKQFSKKPALEIEVQDEQDDNQNQQTQGQQDNLQFYKDSTKNLLSQNKVQGFLTDRPIKPPALYEESNEQLKVYAKNRLKIKAKEYEDHHQYNNNNFNNNKILMTQPLEIVETQEDLEEAKKEFFKEIAETRLDPKNPNNFNSPVAKNTFINFLNKGQKPKQKPQQYRIQGSKDQL